MERIDYDFIKFQNFQIYYDNENSVRQTLREVFDNGHYRFETSSEPPVIIDAGSNIGISVLFFKRQHPHAKIICFEPDPNAFSILKLNIEVNQLKDIQLINAALSANEGLVDFYGQIHGKETDARGSSIIDIWGRQRTGSSKLKVKSVKLSSYIHSKIDFLKLDIEGAEEEVLKELGDKLSYVKAMALEFHESELIKSVNSLERVQAILKNYNFDYEVISNDVSVLPEAVKPWAEKMNPYLYTIKASQKL